MNPSQVNPMRERVGAWIESDRVQGLIIGLIVLNAVILGLETSEAAMEWLGRLPSLLDRGILAVFVVEIGPKLYARRLGFFREPWSVFDFVVVGIALIPTGAAVRSQCCVPCGYCGSCG